MFDTVLRLKCAGPQTLSCLTHVCCALYLSPACWQEVCLLQPLLAAACAPLTLQAPCPMFQCFVLGTGAAAANNLNPFPPPTHLVARDEFGCVRFDVSLAVCASVAMAMLSGQDSVPSWASVLRSTVVVTFQKARWQRPGGLFNIVRVVLDTCVTVLCIAGFVLCTYSTIVQLSLMSELGV
jgi:hypothetical protein